MKYFIDTEFIAGFHKPFFGKRRHFIDLISIGIIAEDGREYYAISSEYNFKDADEWVQANVIMPMYRQQPPSFKMQFCSETNFQKYCGKNNAMIANDIQGFIYGGGVGIDHEFYGYYADYDWVLFCSLFGRMIDLPKGFPMYCKDLKQTLDETAYSRKIQGRWVGRDSNESKLDYEIRNLKAHPNYPKQENEHNALADAKWNKKLYEFLQNI